MNAKKGKDIVKEILDVIFFPVFLSILVYQLGKGFFRALIHDGKLLFKALGGKS